MKLKVIDKRCENDSCFSLIFEKPANFNFYPGQYIDIELLINDKVKSDRLFTISSSPTENFLMITAKKGSTDFKESMVDLQVGDNVNASHPAGTFTLDESQPAVFITGGIGITPFRSIIKYAVDQQLPTNIILIYSNSDNNFPFKKNLDNWQKQLPNLTIHYLDTSKHKRLNIATIRQILNFPLSNVNYIYYLAGLPKMVDDFAKMLLEEGVDETNIRYDRFDGY